MIGGIGVGVDLVDRELDRPKLVLPTWTFAAML